MARQFHSLDPVRVVHGPHRGRRGFVRSSMNTPPGHLYVANVSSNWSGFVAADDLERISNGEVFDADPELYMDDDGSYSEDNDEFFCRTCGELNVNGEGYDGECGNCADRRESRR